MTSQVRRPEVPQSELLIGGEALAPAGSEYIVIWDLATGDPLRLVGRGRAHDIDKAVEAARSAYQNVWRKVAPVERSRILAQWERPRTRGMLLREFEHDGSDVRDRLVAARASLWSSCPGASSSKRLRTSPVTGLMVAITMTGMIAQFVTTLSCFAIQANWNPTAFLSDEAAEGSNR